MTAGGLAAGVGIAELLARRAGDDGIGLVFEDRRWTWADVWRESLARAALLTAHRGEPFHVGVLLDNVPEYLFLLGGAALCGATIVGINPTRRGDALAHDILHTDCRLVITNERYAGLMDGLDVGVTPDRVLRIEDRTWAALLDANRNATITAPLPPASSLWVLIFTSGSAGAPKAVRASQGRMAATSGMGFGPDDVLYCAMPLFHGNALSANIVPALASGATIALRRRFSASEFLPDIRRLGATYFNTVGRAISYILATPPSEHDRDHRLKFVLGPETSAVDAAAFTARFGVPLIQGYGSSEGAIRMQPVGRPRPGSLGRPDPGTDVAVVDSGTLAECQTARFDSSGAFLNPAEAIGEIVRRDGGSHFEGYYNNDAANAERTRNGWFWSGDLGYRDADGVFYFAGRNADWLRVDGENFAAAPIERIIERHPAVAGVAVYGVPDPVTGDQVVAAVELTPAATFDGRDFADFLTRQTDLGTKWAPRFVRLVEALPVTATGKIDKAPLRRRAWHPPGEVWWRPDDVAAYRPLTAGDAAALDAELARNGRSVLLEAAT